jgi:small conductance mechanosensitive channel
MLLTFRPFKVGDVINVAGNTGGVEEIGLFTTAMNTPDNRHIIVPNSAVFGATIVNITHNTSRRVDISVGVDYDAKIDDVREVLKGCIKNIPSRDASRDDEHQVFLVGLGGSSVDWQVRVHGPTDKYWDIHQETIRAIKMALDGADIGIPYPNVVVHTAADPAAAAAASTQA